MSDKSKGNTIVIIVASILGAILLFGGTILGTMYVVSKTSTSKGVASTDEFKDTIKDKDSETEDIKDIVTEEYSQIKQVEPEVIENKVNVEELLIGFQKQYDDMEEITWYKPKGEESFLVKNDTESFQLYPYVGVSDSGMKLCRLISGFSKEGWVFFDEITIKADNTINKIAIPPFERKSEVIYAAGIQEWVDVPIDRELYSKLKPLINSSDAKIRFSGDTNYTEYTINKQQKQQIKEVLDVFEAIEGI